MLSTSARRVVRIPGDPDDWHTVAVAMATATAIWTLDQKHFFGCGMAIWNTKVLVPYSRLVNVEAKIKRIRSGEQVTGQFGEQYETQVARLSPA